MTSDEFRAALRDLGIHQNWLADKLGLALSTVNRWAVGELAVPQYAVFVIDLLRENRELRRSG